MYGSVAGVYWLKIERKTSPETVSVPSEPTRVTLMTRPDTPRFDRSIALSAPTFDRGSASNTVDSWA